MKNVYYNITYNVDETVVERWLNWMKKDFIPQLLSTEYFLSIKILRILVEEEMGGESFAVMYKSKNSELLEEYVVKHSDEFNKLMTEKFGQKVVSFMTLLEEEYSI